IKADDQFDHNDKKGYFLPLYNENSEKMKGSNSAIAFYAVRQGSDYGIKMDKKAAFETIHAEMSAHPELQSDWSNSYLQMAYRNDKVEGKKLIDAYSETFNSRSDIPEKEYSA